MSIVIVPDVNIDHIAKDVFLPNKKLKLMSASEWQAYPWNDFRVFCHTYARYGIPTTELIGFLAAEIDHRPVLEIGAGAGDLGHHLAYLCGVTMTDSKQQNHPLIKAQYKAMHQPTISYPSDVIQMEASDAVNYYKPKVVIASWITTYAPHEMPYGSNPLGVKEMEILPLVDKFILIGNLDTHGDKPIMSLPHHEYKFDWLVSRAKHKENNRIWIWENNK